MGKWKTACLDAEEKWAAEQERASFQEARADLAEADRDESLENSQIDRRDLMACESRAEDYLDEIKGLRIQLAERTEQRDMWAEAYWNYFNRRTPSFIHRCAPCTRRHWPFR